ncbi:hypothetical protein HLK66_15920 [Niallia circulans]|uniref:hypothetical protein n=1 Tax=Niallia circulans TaxID=1397 RepID=UPI00148FD100|nr:hypothetical protein [Niallia circulans]QJX62997.1 hypothetical protein HLK66_15920 [Niallia circulans]
MKMKMKYKILYKSGHEDEIIQEATEQEVQTINDLIITSFNENTNGYITLGDGEKKGRAIRLADVSRVEVENL